MPRPLRLGTSIAATAGLIATTFATALVAAPAHAASASFSGGVLTVSLSTPDWFRVQADSFSPGRYLVITGGPGRDSISTGGGNDTVNSRDGEIDSVNCGLGADTLVGDKIDVVNSDPLGRCESQSLANAPGKAKLILKAPNRLKVKKRVATFTVTNGFAKTVRLSVTVKKKKRTLGSAKVTVKAKAKGKIKIQLTKKAMKLIKRNKPLKVTVHFKAIKGAKAKGKIKTKLV